MLRHDLLKHAALLAPLVVAGRACAAPAATRTRLLVVFLRGAYDAVNIVAPVGSDFYHQARPTIGRAKPDAANTNAALPLDGDWALHPALDDMIYPVAPARNCVRAVRGTDDLNRSLFETQDTLELGRPLGGTRDYRSGLMARLAAMLGRDKPIAFTDQLPFVFAADPPCPTWCSAARKPTTDARAQGWSRRCIRAARSRRLRPLGLRGARAGVPVTE